jgi:hypothetical protein
VIEHPCDSAENRVINDVVSMALGAGLPMQAIKCLMETL